MPWETAALPGARQTIRRTDVTELRIDDMPCRQCASGIARPVWSLDATASVEFDPARRRVRIESALGAYKFVAAIAGAGFTPRAVRANSINYMTSEN